MTSLPQIPRSFPAAERDAALVLCLLRYTDNIRHDVRVHDTHQLIIRYETHSCNVLQIATLFKQGHTRIQDLKHEIAALFNLGQGSVDDFILQHEGMSSELENSVTLSSLRLHGVTVLRMSTAFHR